MSSRARALLFAVLAGVLAALSQPPFSWPVVLAVALPGMFWLWQSALTNARAFWIGWFVGLGYFGVTLHWIVEPFLVQPEIFGWMIPFALTGMAGGMALFWGAGFWVAKRIGSRGWGAPFALTFGLVGMEWLRGNILSGFPWSLIGYAWVEDDIIQVASFVGVYGLTLLTVLGGSMLGQALVKSRWWMRTIFVIPVITLYLATVTYGYVVMYTTHLITGVGPQIGLVQPNVAQKDKWQPALREQHLNDLLDKTRQLSDQGADVVIWPEAATPYQFDKAPQLRAMIADALKPGGILLAGGIRFEGDTAFNSLIALDSSGIILDSYDKQHLVPFGEKMPLEPLLSRIGLRAMIALPGGFSTGKARERSMCLGDLPPLVPMICYEAIFPAEIMRRAAKGDWLVQVTNDAWFGNWVGPYQHFAMARVRAIERGLPVARAANTGVSAMIDPYGRVLASLPLNEAGILLHALPSRTTATMYSRYEDIPFGLGLLICLGLGLLSRKRVKIGANAVG